jgi:hypothetical protein
LPLPYAYCPNLANSIRVLPTLIRVLRISSPNSYAYRLFHTRTLRVTTSHYAYQQRPIHVQNVIFLSHTRKASPHTRTNISYAYCLVPYAYDQRPEFSDLQWLSLLRDLPNSTFYSPIFTQNSFLLSNSKQILFDSTRSNISTLNSYEFFNYIPIFVPLNSSQIQHISSNQR